jgi:predicted Na+-dependent transporter
VFPRVFLVWFEGTPLQYNLTGLILPLIQIIMFGMGTTLSLADFARIFKMPWPVFIGMLLQFSVMPLTGLGITYLLGIKGEYAAGVVLIGSCPGGVASNLMTYLAGGDVALSVTMTSCSTLMSPVMTPFMMEKLASQFVEVSFLKMMFEIINMIIVPIVAGLVANRILYSSNRAFHRAWPVALMAAAGILCAVGVGMWHGEALISITNIVGEQAAPATVNVGIWDHEALISITRTVEAPREAEEGAALEGEAPPAAGTAEEAQQHAETPEQEKKTVMLNKDGAILGLLLIGVVALAKLIVSIWLKGPESWMDKTLPLVSMIGICVIIAIITAKSKTDLMKEQDVALKAVALLAVAAVLQNAVGYVLGYWGARAARLDESSCRTVAIEVGLQNGGMASGLAMNVLESAKAAIAPAIFGPWMNVSGSVLATWWHRKPVPIPGHEKSAHDSGSELAEQQ